MGKSHAAREGSGESFWTFLLHRVQRKDMRILFGAFLVLYVALIYCYPTPVHCLPDASGYILAAAQHWKVNYRPYGYSAFLNLVHGINSRMWFLTFCQYWLYALSLTVFLFTIKYFFPVRRSVFYGIMALCLLSPVSLYFTNYAISDSLFNSLTIFWITTGIWQLYRRKAVLVIVHLITMLFAIHVKYAGLVYPFLSAFVLFLAFRPVNRWRAYGVCVLPILLLFFYYTTTVRAVKRETGTSTFSGFSGWSLANNGVSVIPFVKIDKRTLKDPEIRMAHHFIEQFPDSLYAYSGGRSTEFIWDNNGPGKALLKHIIASHRQDYFRAWVRSGRIWGKYGNYLLRNHPVEFVRYFMVPNLGEVFYPSRLHLPPCNTALTEMMQSWYNSPNETFSYRFDIVGHLEGMLRICNLLSWLTLVMATLLFLVRYRKLTLDQHQKLVLITGLIIIICYTGFVVIGHPFEQRYIINLHVLKVTLPVIIINACITTASGQTVKAKPSRV